MTETIGPVLVASDFSESAVEALRQGALNAKAMAARLLMVHVVHLSSPIHPIFPHLSQRDTEREVSLGRELSDRLIELATEHTDLDPAEIDTDVDFSDVPYATIARKAEHYHARLVVIGHHGNAGPHQRLLGSVAERVVRAVHCPVLVARGRSGTERLLVATDLSDPASRAVEYAADVSRNLGYQLLAVHNIELPSGIVAGLGPLGPVPAPPTPEAVSEMVAAAHTLLRDQLGRFGAAGETLVTAEPKTDEAILRIAEEHDVDLIVVGSHGRSGIARIALGSIAESIVHRARCSVLAVRC